MYACISTYVYAYSHAFVPTSIHTFHTYPIVAK